VKRLAAVAAMLLLPLFAAGCGGPVAAPARTPVTLVLDWYPNSDHAGIYAAQDKGYYSAAGLDVKIQVPTDVTDALKLVATGRADFAVSYEPDTLIARSQGLPDVAVMSLVQEPLNSIISLKSEDITTPRDLVGKTIGWDGVPADQALLSTVLKADGASLSQVHTVVIGTSLVSALLSHQVNAILDGYFTWEGLIVQSKGQPVNVIHLQDWGVPSYDELVIVTSENMVKNHPATVRAFVQATQKGLSFAIAHPAQAASFVVKAGQGLDASLVRQSVALLVPGFKGPDGIPGDLAPAGWASYAKWLSSEKLVSHPVSGAKAVDTSFLRK